MSTTAAVSMRDASGSLLSVPTNRWFGTADTIDTGLLERVSGPVLDIGCGPGRHVVALAERGIPALGIDVTTGVLDIARRRGASVIERSVFDHVPGTGRWSTVLLLDGNIGIGGDPVALLQRVRRLVHRSGTVLVELEPSSAPRGPRLVRFEIDGVPGPWFKWACVTVSDLDAIARASRFAPVYVWSDRGRWFAHLRCER